MSTYGPRFLLTLDDYSAAGFVDREGGRWVGRDTAGRKVFDRKDFDGAKDAAKSRRFRLVTTSYYETSARCVAADGATLAALIEKPSCRSEADTARAELERRAAAQVSVLATPAEQTATVDVPADSLKPGDRYVTAGGGVATVTGPLESCTDPRLAGRFRYPIRVTDGREGRSLTFGRNGIAQRVVEFATEAPAPAEPASVDFAELGRMAFERGESSAPILNPQVYRAVECLPVGGGAMEIFQAFSAGWQRARLAAPTGSRS